MNIARVAVVVGNPHAGGRTTAVAEAVGAAVVRDERADGAAVTTYELAHIAAHLFEWGNRDVVALTEQVAAADVIIAACPTYKASYTGLLKAFFDNYGNDALAGRVAVPVMVGAAAHHTLAVEVHLRPLLVELGACVPARGLYVLESQIPDLHSVIAAWSATAVPLICAASAAVHSTVEHR